MALGNLPQHELTVADKQKRLRRKTVKSLKATFAAFNRSYAHTKHFVMNEPFGLTQQEVQAAFGTDWPEFVSLNNLVDTFLSSVPEELGGDG